MKTLNFVVVFLLLTSFTFAQKYVFENKAVYEGIGLFHEKPKYGKYIIYWSIDKKIIALEIFDNEGINIATTIFDPQNNRLIGIDEREKKGFIVKYDMYATNKIISKKLDSSMFVGTNSFNNKICREYKYQFPNGQIATFCIINALFNSDLLKFLEKTGYAFMPLPYGFKGIISNYTLINNKGNELASLKLTDLSLNAYFVFNLYNYKLQRY